MKACFGNDVRWPSEAVEPVKRRRIDGLGGPSYGISDLIWPRHIARDSRRAGLSLLEVMLALAILGAALAAIGELMRTGARNAEMARDLTTAQLLCESTLAEIQLQFLPMQTVGPVQVNDLQYQQQWLYSITVEPIDQEGLSSVWVRIEQNPEIFSRPVSFTATRWMIDPTVAALTDESSTTTGGAGG